MDLVFFTEKILLIATHITKDRYKKRGVD